MNVARIIRRLRRDAGGVAIIEFALGAPLFLGALVAMTELANYALVRQQISQLALQVADNASRIGAQNVMTNKPITEGEINDLFKGAEIQGGSLDIRNRGRIILSSLELNSDTPTPGQWLHWQRCDGNLAYGSSWGHQGDGITGSGFPGMGPAASQIKATANTTVMFVEIGYDYVPIIALNWVPSTRIVEIAALAVRDSRDTSQVYPTSGQTPSNCGP